MKINEIITESASKILYHFTTPNAALQILKNGYFDLTSSLGRASASKFAPKNKIYYLSCTRTLLGGYHDRVSDFGVMLNLDGDYYNQRYKAGPVDYYGNRQLSWKPSEAEDRIFSEKHHLPADGVTEIHVFLDPDTLYEPSRAMVRKLLIEAKVKHVPVFYYENHSAWKLQRKDKAIPITSDSVALHGKEKINKAYPNQHTVMNDWLELIHKNKKADLSFSAGKLCGDLVNYPQGHGEARFNDIVSTERKSHSQHHPELIKLLTQMQKHRWATGKDFIDAMHKKWKDLYWAT